jgi:mannose/cellobiose epimerase-like protein (N-acyl-D-glucosamine 2-epimerase family)
MSLASHPNITTLRTEAWAAHDELIRWLTDEAYPMWSTNGIDPVRGGFQESLTLSGSPTEVPRRARVQPRQVYAFAQAPRFRWRGDAASVAAHGLRYFLAHFRRPDGLFRTRVKPDGAPLDDSTVLYDQAFALLAFAAAAGFLGPEFDPAGEADRLRRTLLKAYKRTGPPPQAGLGFESCLPPALPLLSNPHMHLFEACLAWCEKTGAPEWHAFADEIGELALARFIDASTGALRENFDASWAPAAGLPGRIVEPGHQYEWAYLLLRWRGTRDARANKAARRLIDIGEKFGVRHGVAINALLDDFSVHDADARLWPQTERLKAGAIAARLFGEPSHWKVVVEAAAGLTRYFKTPVHGLWYNRLSPSGVFHDEPAPASSFYHIVGAIVELSALLGTNTDSGP